MRVLIADDSADIRKTLAQFCARLPHVEVVAQAENGREALEAFRTLKPDVMTLDIRMPEMGGIEVLKAIKDDPQNCLVIMFTGMTDEYYRRKCLALGAHHFFDKAAEIDKVMQLLKAM